MNGIILIFLSLLFSSSVLSRVTLEDLQKRIEQLENQQADLILNSSEPKTVVNAFLNDNLTLGGFLEPSYTYISGPNTKTQFLNASNILGLNLSAEFGPRYRFVSQMLTGLVINLENPHNNPDASPNLPRTREFRNYFFGTVLTQGYLEYSHSRLLNLQGGLGYAPFGYAPQQRELVLFVRRGGPQLLRSGDLLAPIWQGFHLFGSKNMNRNEVGYNLYTFASPKKLRNSGLGGRLWMSTPNEKFEGGLSAQIGKNDKDSFETVGADIKLESFPYILKAEFAQYITSDPDSWTAYVEPSIYISGEELILYVFGDYVNNRRNEVTTDSKGDPYKKWEYGTGLNWLPTSYTRLRFGFTYNDYVGNRAVSGGINRDYLSVDVSAGVAF